MSRSPLTASTIAVLGAGELGGALARTLAGLDQVRRVLLVDPDGGRAAGLALDIRQAASIEGFGTRVDASAETGDARGAAVVVLADAAAGGAPEPDRELAWLARLAEADERTAFVCARAGDQPLMERARAELGLGRARLVGSAPLAFASAIRAYLGAALDRSPSQIAITVAGVPPTAPWCSGRARRWTACRSSG